MKNTVDVSFSYLHFSCNFRIEFVTLLFFYLRSFMGCGIMRYNDSPVGTLEIDEINDVVFTFHVGCPGTTQLNI